MLFYRSPPHNKPHGIWREGTQLRDLRGGGIQSVNLLNQLMLITLKYKVPDHILRLINDILLSVGRHLFWGRGDLADVWGRRDPSPSPCPRTTVPVSHLSKITLSDHLSSNIWKSLHPWKKILKSHWWDNGMTMVRIKLTRSIGWKFLTCNTLSFCRMFTVTLIFLSWSSQMKILICQDGEWKWKVLKNFRNVHNILLRHVNWTLINLSELLLPEIAVFINHHLPCSQVCQIFQWTKHCLPIWLYN